MANECALYTIIIIQLKLPLSLTIEERNITLFVHICIHIHVIKQMIKPKYLC